MVNFNRWLFLTVILWVVSIQIQGIKIVIEGFNGTLSKDSLSLPSQSRHLVIGSNQIRTIETGAICTTPMLQIVEINFKENTDPPILTQDMFENCENVTELKIFGSPKQPSPLNYHIFQNFANLKSLRLHDGLVERLTRELFTGLTSLTDLVLSKCGIKEVTSSVFKDLKNLEDVKLDNNNITTLPEDLFRGVPHLKILDLSNNNISSLDWSEFDGLSSLQNLNLGFNQISSFDVDRIVRYMPKLEHVVIRHNAVDCYTKEQVAEELKQKLGHTVEVIFYDFVFFDYTDCEAEERHRFYLVQRLINYINQFAYINV